MPRPHRYHLLLVCALLVAGCNLPRSPQATATSSSLPTIQIVPTDNPTATPSATASPLAPTETSTPTQSPTPTLELSRLSFDPQVVLPNAEIEILAPGDGARTTSPLSIRANMMPGPDGRLRVELLGEDGRSLARKLLTWTLISRAKQEINTQLEFEVSGVAEAGRLLVSVEDEYGRLKALSSVDLILISEGDSDFSRGLDVLERAYIVQPDDEVELNGGALIVSGVARPDSERPLEVRAIARDGRVLAFAETYVAYPEGFEYGIFSVALDLSLSNGQWLQISVRESGERLPGYVHYSSREVYVTP